MLRLGFAFLQNLAVSPGLMPRPSLSDLQVRSAPSSNTDVSPGLMPRPSLSGVGARQARRECPQVSPGLMPRPSLSVGQTARRSAGGARARVAGADAPAFVERRTRAPRESGPRSDVSPGLMPRPSLSGHDAGRHVGDVRVGVAGADAPAFVERSWRCRRPAAPSRVSPGLMPRPSLSDVPVWRVGARPEGVAGADAPAFVERFGMPTCALRRRWVSPGLMPRPSLSAGPDLR